MPETPQGLTRRTFLTTSAAAAGAALWARPALAHGSGRLSIAFIGMGRRGETLARLCAELPDVRVSSIYDAHGTRSERVAAAIGATPCNAFEKALRGVDAVIIASPDHVRGSQALAALRAGKHVYIEAPLSLDLHEARQITALAEERGLAVQAGISACSDPRWLRLQDICASGRLGTIRMAQYHGAASTRGLSGGTHAAARAGEVDWNAFDRDSAFDARRYTQWRNYGEYCDGPAAALQLEGITLLSKALGLARPTRISATGGTFAHQHPAQLDALLSTVEWETGCSLHLSASPLAAGQPPIVRGSRGSARILGQRIVISLEREPVAEIVVPQMDPAAHIRNWLGAIAGQTDCACPPRLALSAQETTRLAMQSAKTGQAILT
jgi:predicted dehydrogenase